MWKNPFCCTDDFLCIECSSLITPYYYLVSDTMKMSRFTNIMPVSHHLWILCHFSYYKWFNYIDRRDTYSRDNRDIQYNKLSSVLKQSYPGFASWVLLFFSQITCVKRTDHTLSRAPKACTESNEDMQRKQWRHVGRAMRRCKESKEDMLGLLMCCSKMQWIKRPFVFPKLILCNWLENLFSSSL